MKCEVIRDLIPLYEEKLCSPESADLVAEHIETCAGCRALIEMLPKTEFPKTELPDAGLNEIKPFVKIKRKLRARVIALIALGAVLLAVLIPVGYLTVNQIFHINGGTDFEDLIYKHEARQFAEMIAEGRMEEYVQRCDNGYYTNPDGTRFSYRDVYLEKLNAAYEAVKKYNPRVGEIHSDYFNHNNSLWRDQHFFLEFTRSDGSVHQVRIGSQYAGSSENGIPKVIPVEISKLYGGDPEKTWYENYSDMDEYSPTDLREIATYINTLYLADGGDYDIKMIEKFLHKPTADAYPEDSMDSLPHLVAIRFDISDYKAVYNGFADFKRSNYILDAAVGGEQFDSERNMFYYPVMLIGSDGEREVIVSTKLYYDDVYGLHSPRPEDIKGITGSSDLEAKMAKILG